MASDKNEMHVIEEGCKTRVRGQRDKLCLILNDFNVDEGASRLKFNYR